LPGLFAATLLSAACSTTGQPGTPVSAAPPPGPAPTFIKTIACGIGGIAGAATARALAQSDAKRQRLTPAQLRQREQGYMVSLALLGCAGGSALAGTAYQKLSERGRAAREAELREAASSAQPRTYVDPDNPTLVGRIVPQPAFVEGGQECRVIEDTLADAGKGEPIFVKYCRRPPASAWAPVLA
jgi:surface antigen